MKVSKVTGYLLCGMILAVGILFFVGNNAVAEDVTITTYYPAPYGVYRDMVVTNSLGIGTMTPGYQLELSLNSAGKPGGGPWSDSSDIRLKKNVMTIDGALDKMLRLRGVNYQWKAPEKHGNMTGTYLGMIAQEVEDIFPEWVGTDNEGYKTLGFIGFEALTVEAIRELKAENEALKVRIEALEAKLNVE